MLSLLAKQTYVTEETLIIVEAELNKKFDFVSGLGFSVTKEKLYKTNKHVFIKRSES